MTKKRERDGHDDDAPTIVVDDATERHLVKARALLRQAQSRLTSRDEAAAESNGDQETKSDEGEDSHE